MIRQIKVKASVFIKIINLLNGPVETKVKRKNICHVNTDKNSQFSNIDII